LRQKKTKLLSIPKFPTTFRIKISDREKEKNMKNNILFLLLLMEQIGYNFCLKITEMEVPTHKLVGDTVTLICKFHMEGDRLYSVKWYRNEQEFFRYVPNDRPEHQIFPQHGIRVERNRSKRQEVTLIDLQLEASGTYRCEVSAEAPSFRTKHVEKVMVVVQEPIHNEIVGLKPSYHVGDLVNVTCYSRQSSPPASLVWKVNDNMIYDERGMFGQSKDYNQYQYQTEDGTLVPKVAEPLYLFGTIRDWILTPDNTLNTAASNLQFRVQDHHRHTGLKLECTASIGPIYWHATQETSQVTLPQPDFTSWISSDADNTDVNVPKMVACLISLIVLLI